MPNRRRTGDRNPSQVQPFSIREFFERFPTDDACLEHLMELRYGLRHPCDKCLNLATFHRLAERPAYSCSHCGAHVYPCAGTIFQDTRTPLQMWFYAIYLFVTTRHGVSGKELQRELGVTYKTAWRLGHQVRKETLRNVVLENVEPGSIVSTDELISYGLLADPLMPQMPHEMLRPRIIPRKCGGWLALSNDADMVKIGVTAASEVDADLLFQKTRERWQAILESETAVMGAPARATDPRNLAKT